MADEPSSPAMENVSFEDVPDKKDSFSDSEIDPDHIRSDDDADNISVAPSTSLHVEPSSSRKSSISIPLGNPQAITISVGEPEKHGDGMNAYSTYKVTAKVNLDQYKSKDISVDRRYSHFLWLFQQLKDTYKGVLIPPLPEKAVINRFNAEFLEYRRRELEKFLLRVANHPVLCSSQALQTFLEATSEAQMTETKARAPSGSANSDKGGFLSMLSSISNPFAQQKEIDQWFDAKRGYLAALENALTAIAKANNNLVKKRRELVQSYTELGLAASLLSSCEADHDHWISTSFHSVADIAEQIHSLQAELAESETTYFEDSIKDYLRMIQGAKDMLTNRAELLGNYQNAAKQVDGKKEKLEKVKNTPKAPPAEKELEQAVQKVEEAKAAFDKISVSCRNELERFQQNKLADFQETVTQLVQMNMNHELRVVNLWKTFLVQIQETKPQQDI